jgi:hypothetical protein
MAAVLVGYLNVNVKVSTDLKPSIGQSFHKLRVFHRPKASRGKRYSSRSAALTSAALSSRFSSRLSSGLKRALNNSVNVYSNSEDCRQ